MHQARLVPVLIFISVLCVFCSACISVQDGDSGDGRIQVAVTLLPQAEFAEAVGGEHVEVMVMIPPGASPETYGPTPKDMMDLSGANLFIKVGSPLPYEENYLDRLTAAYPGLQIVDSSEGIEIIGGDPHIWTSPPNAAIMVQHTAEGLAFVDPDHSGEYFRNAGIYIARLEELDTEIEQMVRASSRRSFLVFHPSWGYFAREYGLKQIAIEVEGKEPSANHLREVIAEAEAAGIDQVLVSPQMSTRSAELVAQHLNGTVVYADPLARNYIENMRYVAHIITAEER
jgi:zinc transport system substrate-binding protein